MEEADGRSQSRLMFHGPRIMGLDLMIGGAIPMLARHGDKPQTSILIRGDAGTGKTVLASYLAGEFAKQFNSDVAYACIELLPIELAAQAEGLYPGDEPPFRVIHDWTSTPDVTRPTFWTGMLDLGDRLDHTKNRERFLSELPLLLDAATTKSGNRGVRVLVVDSVSPHYGLGSDAPRMFADDLCKWAASRGVVLIMVEEANSDRGSVWPFAVDLVLDLKNDHPRFGERSLRVPKNRFGRTIGDAAAGLAIAPELDGCEIRPPAEAYSQSGAPNDNMFGQVPKMRAPLKWDESIAPLKPTPLQNAAVLVESTNKYLRRRLAPKGTYSITLGNGIPTVSGERGFGGTFESLDVALVHLRKHIHRSSDQLLVFWLGESQRWTGAAAYVLTFVARLGGRTPIVVTNGLDEVIRRTLFTTRFVSTGTSGIRVEDATWSIAKDISIGDGPP